MPSSHRIARPIDRELPGVGRLTIRTKRMSREARNELDRYIVRAAQEGHIEQLRLLKARRVTPFQFLEAARCNRLPSLRDSPPIAGLVDQWLPDADLRESSRSRYSQSWKALLASLPQGAPLDALTAPWWAEFVSGRQVGPATLNRDRSALLAFLSWAKEIEHQIPDWRPKKLKEEPKQSEILTTSQIATLKIACRPDRWPFFWTLLKSGARQGEILNLIGSDVLADDWSLAIRSKPGSKGKGKTRYVPIPPELGRCLQTLAVVSGSGRLFPYGRTTIREWWAEVCLKAGIKGVTLHGIRATYITMALDNGVSPVDVQKLVGHSSLEMTMRYYRNTEQSRNAARTIWDALDVEEAPDPETAQHFPQQVLPELSPVD